MWNPDRARHLIQNLPSPPEYDGEPEYADGVANAHGCAQELADELDKAVAEIESGKARLAELQGLADLVSDADIGALPPELVAVRQRWIAADHARGVAETLARGEIQ